MAAGATRRMVNQRVEQQGWRLIHPGVYAMTQAPLTRRQLWIAATLTSPASVLSHASAGACWGFRSWEGKFEVITRPGSGGPKRCGSLLVCRSTTLAADTTYRDGIRITTAARTLVDLAAGIDDKATARSFREALRLKVTTPADVRATLTRHQGRRGTKVLGDLAARYATIPYHRTRSDAESLALEVLHEAGIDPPRPNMRIAGEEADLVWPKRRLIVEIDGPQYHQFADEDARKQRLWEKAGYIVRRISSAAVYDEPAALVALVDRSSASGR
jgi:very-short-patch-repair endonuclease